MTVYAILCSDRQGGIGKAGSLPWSLPSDFEYYKAMAKGCIRICGRNTFGEEFSPKEEFYGFTIVVSQSLKRSQMLVNHVPQKIAVVGDLEEALKVAEAKSSVTGLPIFLTGGKRI